MCSATNLGKPLTSSLVFKLSTKLWYMTYSRTSSFISDQFSIYLIKVSSIILHDQVGTFAGFVSFVVLNMRGDTDGEEPSIFEIGIPFFKELTIVFMFSVFCPDICTKNLFNPSNSKLSSVSFFQCAFNTVTINLIWVLKSLQIIKITSEDSRSDLVQGPPLMRRLGLPHCAHSSLHSSILIKDVTLFFSLLFDKDSKFIINIFSLFDEGDRDGIKSPWHILKKQTNLPDVL